MGKVAKAAGAHALETALTKNDRICPVVFDPYLAIFPLRISSHCHTDQGALLGTYPVKFGLLTQPYAQT